MLEQWAAALRTPSMQRAHLECTGPHALGTEFLRHVVEESTRTHGAHTKHTAPPVYLYPWVDIPAIAFW